MLRPLFAGMVFLLGAGAAQGQDEKGAPDFYDTELLDDFDYVAREVLCVDPYGFEAGQNQSLDPKFWQGWIEEFYKSEGRDRMRLRNEPVVELASRAYELDPKQEDELRSILIGMREQDKESAEKQESMSSVTDEMLVYRAKFFISANTDEDRVKIWGDLMSDEGYRALMKESGAGGQRGAYWIDSLEKFESGLPDKQKLGVVERRRARQGAMTGKVETKQETKQETKVESKPMGTSPVGQPGPGVVVAGPRTGATGGQTAAAGVGQALAPSHWEKYVKEFVKRHHLDASQEAAAMGILKQLSDRARQIEKSNEKPLQDAMKLPNMEARARRVAELRQPIEQLFKDLQARLLGLLSAKQRAGNSGAKPAGQPAAGKGK